MRSPAVGTRAPAKAALSRAPAAASSAPAKFAQLSSPETLSAPALLKMQAGAGNAAVASMLMNRPHRAVQRRVDPTMPPAPPNRTLPMEDPRFVAVHGKVKSAGASLKKHPKAGQEVNSARAAAEPPANDAEAQAKADKVAEMSGAKPGAFDKAKFVAAVRKAIEANQPKTLEDADNAGKSGKANDVKNQVMGEVVKGKDGSAADIKNTTASAPDPSKAQIKPVTPMQPAGAVATPAVAAGAAMPAPVPAEQLNLQAGKHETDEKIASAGVTKDTLANSNEPQFKDALAAKQAGEAHADSAPGEVRAAEAGTLAGAQAGAAGSAAGKIAAMVAGKAGGTSQVASSKSNAKAKEEAERKQVATQIESIFSTTKTETEGILKGVDAQVDAEFTKGEAEAKAAFENSHTTKMQAWKDKRYMGGLNYGQWIADKIMGLPPEVQTFFTQARELYIQKMEAVISNVADLIGRELTRARDRIAKGRADVKAFVSSQPGNLKKYASEAEQSISGQFEQLDQSVDDKQEGLVDDLASKYSEAKGAIDERVQALQDESKGLWDAAKAAVGETVDTILKLKDLVLSVFARVASAVDRIIQDPIGFLGKFVNAVKAGLDKFIGNIGTHLKKGLQGWLFGALADAGIEIPETFDLKGILKLVLSVIGATWQALRAMIVKRIGEPVMAKLESAVGFVKTLVTEGPAGLWKMFVAKIGDIKSMVMEQVKSFLITKVITAGITWLISMLNPAGAFAKACKMIVDVVNFFVEKGEAIKGVIDSAVESVEEILAGGVSKVAGMIEDALAKVVPVLIGLLASLLGLGGISEKIQKILETLRKPVNKAMDFVVGKVVKLGKGLLRKMKNSKLGKMAAKAKAKVKAGIAKGKAFVKGKVDAGKAWVKKKVAGGKAYVKKKIVAGKEALFRLLRKPFSAVGKNHVVSVSPAGKILIASDEPASADVHDAGARRQAEASGQMFQYPSIQQLTALMHNQEHALAAIKAAEVDGLNPSDPRNARFLRAIEEVASMARQVWSLVHYTGHPGDAGQVDDDLVGQIAPYVSNKGRKAGGPPLIAEHVLPFDWLRNIFVHKLGLEPLSRLQYNQMTTILIHQSAAGDKTTGDQGDNDVPHKREMTASEVAEILNSGSMISMRVERTLNAVLSEHTSSGRTGPPKPNGGQVKEAAGRQMGEVIRMARERAGVATTAAGDFNGSATLVQRATALLANPTQAGFVTKAGNLSGRFTAWIRDNSSTAPPNTRTVVVAQQEALVAEKDRQKDAADAAAAATAGPQQANDPATASA